LINCAISITIRNAIGWSLPYVGLPRDSSFFASAKTYSQAVGPWRKAFEKLLAQRAPLLAKQRSNGQPIDPEEMRQRMIENSASIDPAAQPTLEAFINAPLGDDSITWDVAQLEWEEHGVHFISMLEGFMPRTVENLAVLGMGPMVKPT
jgi:S-DNA-T family DNA segregation ATPase FtsK/SpoIIIE